MKNLEENNKLIAEFMGFKLPDINNPDSLYSKDIKRKGTTILDMSTGRRFHTMVDDKVLFDGNELMFHISWDWLMPVVEKIENVEIIGDDNYFRDVFVIRKKGSCKVYVQCNSELDSKYFVSYHHIGDEKENTYKAVVEFIKWYNENK